jgi:hypothetical protein
LGKNIIIGIILLGISFNLPSDRDEYSATLHPFSSGTRRGREPRISYLKAIAEKRI